MADHQGQVQGGPAVQGAAGEAAPLTAAQKQLHRRREELSYWKQNMERIRRRNLWTGLAIGAFALGMFTYTIVSVKQERILDELDDEARIHIVRGPRTGANS